MNKKLNFKHSKPLKRFLAKWIPHVSKSDATIIKIAIGYAEHWNPKRNDTKPSQIRIANYSQVSTKTVERATKTLQKAGVWNVKKQQRKNNLISFNFETLLHWLKMSVQKCLSKQLLCSNNIKTLNSIENIIADAFDNEFDQGMKVGRKYGYQDARKALGVAIRKGISKPNKNQKQRLDTIHDIKADISASLSPIDAKPKLESLWCDLINGTVKVTESVRERLVSLATCAFGSFEAADDAGIFDDLYKIEAYHAEKI